MDQHEFLQYATTQLNRLQIPYFVTGSFAGVVYGEQRMTNDIDIVVGLREEHIEPFLAAFPSETFLVSRESVIDAIGTHFQFNIIHMDSLTKVDFIVSPDSPHDREALRRVRRVPINGREEVVYVAPEDLLLKKLSFHKESGSEKHLRDCVGILKRSGPLLDMGYLEKWVSLLDVRDSWESARELAQQKPLR